MNCEFYWALGGAAIGAIIVAVAGGVMTVTGDWYHRLKFPGWKPPDWAFGPIWTAILIMAVIATAYAWVAAPDRGMQSIILMALIINAGLNILWNALFFAMKRPDFALIEVILLWLSILALALLFAQVSTLAALLMLPYLVWVGIASALNLAIVRLNPPFRRIG
jgi:benzodiazapine receptor